LSIKSQNSVGNNEKIKRPKRTTLAHQKKVSFVVVVVVGVSFHAARFRVIVLQSSRKIFFLIVFSTK
jgi:hypothetical protein